MPKRGAPKAVGRVPCLRNEILSCLYSTLRVGSSRSCYLYPNKTPGPFNTPSPFIYNVRLAGHHSPRRVSHDICAGAGLYLRANRGSDHRCASSRPYAPILPPCSPIALLRPMSQIPVASAWGTTSFPYPRPSTTSPPYGHLRRCSRMTHWARPCGPTSQAAYRTFRPRGRFPVALSMRPTMARMTRTAVSCSLSRNVRAEDSEAALFPCAPKARGFNSPTVWIASLNETADLSFIYSKLRSRG